MALVPYDHEVLTVTDGAVSTLDSTKLSNGPAVEVVVAIEVAPVRLYVDGTAPTTSAGMSFLPGDAVILDEEDELSNFKVIAISATDAKLYATYYR